MEFARAITWILITVFFSLEFVKSESTEGQTSEKNSTNAQGPVNVIIFTYSRSGSSFAGELFSSHPAASYVFEPLYYPSMILLNDTSAAYNEVMTKLLTCDTAMLDKVRKDPIMVMIRKLGGINDHFLEPKYNSQRVADLCNASTHHVIKTIRLRLGDALQLIQAGNIPNLKILHLMRDPRARYNSVMDKSGFWNDKERNVDAICGRMERDLRMAESMPPSQYKLLKYEDVVANPTAVAEDIYANIFGLRALPEETKTYIRDHAKKGASTDAGYYDTVRSSKFVPSHWEHDLNRTTIEMLQNHPSCKYVINKMNYTMKQFND